ncbi:hypothetical protein Sjap_001928 [Stephania japonica]|uniref:HIT domain-containing protein n=1 Tax=Stephania japonica TaxID=461633 RepID=A0AAP0PS04_9MAGN
MRDKDNKVEGISRVGIISSHLVSSSSTPPMASSEKEAALSAIPSDSPTIFDKIINKEIPSNVVYEDDKVLAFRDIAPQAPVHVVLIPKLKDGLTGLSKLTIADLNIRWVSTDSPIKVRQAVIDSPTRGQSVYHLHIHILGGRQMNWPPASWFVLVVGKKRLVFNQRLVGLSGLTLSSLSCDLSSSSTDGNGSCWKLFTLVVGQFGASSE